MGTRKVHFSRVLYIEQDDFREDPPKKFFRLAPGREVRLRYGYFITCVGVVKDENTGEVIELHCTYDPETRGGNAPDGRKVKATLHWVSAAHAVPVEVRLYDRLFSKPNPEDVEEGADFRSNLNPNSLEVLDSSVVEKIAWRMQSQDPSTSLRDRVISLSIQSDSAPGKLVFNRTISLRDTWAKIEKSMKK